MPQAKVHELAFLWFAGVTPDYGFESKNRVVLILVSESCCYFTTNSQIKPTKQKLWTNVFLGVLSVLNWLNMSHKERQPQNDIPMIHGFCSAWTILGKMPCNEKNHWIIIVSLFSTILSRFSQLFGASCFDFEFQMVFHVFMIARWHHVMVLKMKWRLSSSVGKPMFVDVVLFSQQLDQGPKSNNFGVWHVQFRRLTWFLVSIVAMFSSFARRNQKPKHYLMDCKKNMSKYFIERNTFILIVRSPTNIVWQIFFFFLWKLKKIHPK